MKQFLLMFFFILVVIQLYSQTERFSVEIVVVDTSYASIKDVAIYDELNNLKGVTNSNGITSTIVSVGEILLFTHIGYERKTVCIDRMDIVVKDDGLFSMLVELCPKVNNLQEVTIMENVPHLAYENKMVWVVDYKVQHDGIYMVAGNGTDYCILHLGFEQDTISRKPVSSKFQEFYSDAFGNLQLISSDSVYQVYCDGGELHLLYGNSIES